MLKRLAFRALALAFALCRVFPVRDNKIVLLRHFPVWGSLGALGEALEHDGRFRVVRIASWKHPAALFHLATAGAVCLNNNFNLLPYLPFSKKTRVIQLWHGDGALKRWGFSLDENRGNRVIEYDAVVCCIQTVRPYWAQAFGLPEDRVLPLGSPRMDALLRPCDEQALRARFDEMHPQCRGKRLFLYAPTFREAEAQNAALLSHFDFAAFDRQFNGAAILLVRLHPKTRGKLHLPPCAVDVSGEPDGAALLRVCERLITDYSSIMLDAAALGIPVVLYAFDYDAYMAGRGFYQDLRALPPGPVVTEFGELLAVLAKPDESERLREAFVKFHLGEVEGDSCGRIAGLLTSPIQFSTIEEQ